MRKIVLAAAVTGVFALSACGKADEKTPAAAATPTKTPPTAAEIDTFKKKVDAETNLQMAYHLALEAPTDELSQYARDHAEKLQKEQLGAKK